jgi:hypothetical protein
MTRRVQVTIGRMTVEGAAVADPAAFRAEVERQLALRLGATGADAGLVGRHQTLADAGSVRSAGDPGAVAGAITAAIRGSGKR